jgi:hypothetical protein
MRRPRSAIPRRAEPRRIFSAVASRLILLSVAMFALAGCGSGHETASPSLAIVDGFMLGASEACSPPIGSIDPKFADASCAGMLQLATLAFDAREPGHAAIASAKRYADGTQPGPIDMTGNAQPPAAASRHSGPDLTVFVFTLTDGSMRATGVACVDSTSCTGIATYPSSH